jgi:hypothetical protein
MTSNFASAMTSCAKTWNGAISLSTPDITGESNGRVGLFFKSVRGLKDQDLYAYMRKSADENLIDTFLLAFHIRDCRGGKGERDLGRKCLIWLFLNYTEEFNCITRFIAEYGRWDDLIELWPSVLDLRNIKNEQDESYLTILDEAKLNRIAELQILFVKMFGDQLVSDREDMEAGKPISICAKWAPTEMDSYDRKYGVALTLTKVMGVTFKQYRKKYITPLRQYLKIVERYMCDGKWDEIEYSKVPSCAMKRLKKAFEKHSPEQFLEWKNKLQKGEVTVKAKQLFPHELIHEIRTKHIADQVCEAQWKVLEEEAKKLGVLEDTLFVCDVSQSMNSWTGDCQGFSKKTACPMDVAIGISLLGANTVQGPFHNHIITFHERPTFHVVRDESIYNRFLSLIQAPWGGSTNLQATFELILSKAIAHGLSQDDMPKRFFIISDMQFDIADRTNNITNFQAIKSKYAASGYVPPKIIFWNVCGSSSDYPVSVTDDGTALVSGFSSSILSSFINQTDFSPYTILRTALDSERLAPIRRVLKVSCLEELD